MELKTLKDFEVDEHWCNSTGMPSIKAEKGKHLVISEDLKKNAIKWIKDFEDLKKSKKEPRILANNYMKEHFGFEWMEMEIIVKFLKYLRNITEEDLK